MVGAGHGRLQEQCPSHLRVVYCRQLSQEALFNAQALSGVRFDKRRFAQWCSQNDQSVEFVRKVGCPGLCAYVREVRRRWTTPTTPRAQLAKVAFHSRVLLYQARDLLERLSRPHTARDHVEVVQEAEEVLGRQEVPEASAKASCCANA